MLFGEALDAEQVSEDGGAVRIQLAAARDCCGMGGLVARIDAGQSGEPDAACVAQRYAYSYRGRRSMSRYVRLSTQLPPIVKANVLMAQALPNYLRGCPPARLNLLYSLTYKVKRRLYGRLQAS